MKMEKIIIENRTTVPMEEAILLVARVISEGRISNNNTEYCYASTFAGGISVVTSKNKHSDRFVVVNRTYQNRSVEE